MNNEVVNDEPFSIYTFTKYISENIIGLLLLILAIFIIYIVDYIGRYNSLVFSMPNPIPGISQVAQIPLIKSSKIKGKKFKK